MKGKKFKKKKKKDFQICEVVFILERQKENSVTKKIK